MTGRQESGDRGCSRAREWVSLRADGELSELEQLLLARHLERCDPCTKFARGVDFAVATLREAAVERPSRRLEPAEVEAPAAWRRARYRVAAAAAVAAVAAGVAGFLVTGENGESPAPRPVIDIAEAPRPAPDLPEPPATDEEPV